MRIVLAIDGSESSIHARDLVARLPWPRGTAITLLTAYYVPATWVSGAGAAGEWLVAAEDELRRQLRDELTELGAPLRDRGWEVDQRLVDGRPASLIMSVADELDADLIVLGSRGKGTIQTMLLGSVSAEVADKSDRSVLVARGADVTRLLVATDGSECSAVIPQVIGSWSVFGNHPALALSVTPVDSPAFEVMTSLYSLGSADMEKQREELIGQHREDAERMARQLGEVGIQAEPLVRSGDTAHEIVKVAGERGADLIVTGSRCLHGLERWILGSVARNVLLHAHASVLVVRYQRAIGEVGPPA